MKTDREKLKIIFAGLLEFCEEQDDPEFDKVVLEELDELLDVLVCEDFFGTEAQCDPRRKL